MARVKNPTAMVIMIVGVDQLIWRPIVVWAQRFRLEGKGDIATAYDADLWIVDLSGDDVVRREDLLYRNPFSAHEGQRIRGRTVKTLVRGGEPGSGRFIRPAAR